MAAIPLSSAIGSPISGLILGMNGVGGLDGWQWLFIIEAAPAIVLAFVTYFYLTDRPSDAHWLEPDERAWLTDRLAAERRQREAVHNLTLWEVMYNPRVWALAVVYFGLVACNYGVGFWLPQIIKAFGLSNAMTGWVTAIPYAVGAAFMVWYGYRSDSRGERKVHTAVALAIAAAGIAGSTLTGNPTLTVIAFAVGACGVFGTLPVFWTLPTAVLSGTAAAAGIAVINSIGNISGYAAPQMVGLLRDITGSYEIPMVVASLFMLAAAASPQITMPSTRESLITRSWCVKLRSPGRNFCSITTGWPRRRKLRRPSPPKTASGSTSGPACLNSGSTKNSAQA